MAVFARVRARPRVRAPRGVDHRAGRRRLHEQHGSRLSAPAPRTTGDCAESQIRRFQAIKITFFTSGLEAS